jgi:CBS domain-containing protein
MSARAAWRLEALGFSDVHDYAASKADWFACDQPREGTSADVPWAGDLVRDDVPTCAPEEQVGAVRERVLASGYDFCVVLSDERIVMGLLRGGMLASNPEATADDAMELGPRTTRPSSPVEQLLAKPSSFGVKSWIVTTAHGLFLGVLTRDDAERALSRVAGGK